MSSGHLQEPVPIFLNQGYLLLQSGSDLTHRTALSVITPCAKPLPIHSINTPVADFTLLCISKLVPVYLEHNNSPICVYPLSLAHIIPALNPLVAADCGHRFFRSSFLAVKCTLSTYFSTICVHSRYTHTPSFGIK